MVTFRGFLTTVGYPTDHCAGWERGTVTALLLTQWSRPLPTVVTFAQKVTTVAGAATIVGVGVTSVG